MSLADMNRLKHMLDAALEAQAFMKGIPFESLLNDRKTIQAVIRSIEIVGEAAAKLTQEYRELHPEVPWKEIIGMRNWIIHAYFDIDYEHIWNTVHKDLPILIPQLQELLKEFEK